MGIIAIGKQSTIIFFSFQIAYKINGWFPAKKPNAPHYNSLQEIRPVGVGVLAALGPCTEVQDAHLRVAG